MLVPEYSEIEYEAFLDVVWREGSGTLSKCWRPLAGEVAWQARCHYLEFLTLSVHPVWYLGPEGGDYKHWNHARYPHYRRILLRDALQRPDFLEHSRGDRSPDAPKNRPLHATLLHCTTCGHAAIIDGTHRLVAWHEGQFRGDSSSGILLTGLSGSVWPASMHDMNKVCRCLCP